MDNKIRIVRKYSTIRIIVLFMCIFTLFASCKDITIAEFKQKYNWTEVIITTGCFCSSQGSSRYQTYEYLGEEYDLCYGFPCSHEGYQYYVLIDKNAPKKHYLVLWDKPVKPRENKVQLKGVLTKVSKWSINFAYIEYTYQAISDKGQIEYYSGCEAVSIIYYDKLKELQKNTNEITIDCYILEMTSDNIIKVRPFINLKEFNK